MQQFTEASGSIFIDSTQSPARIDATQLFLNIINIFKISVDGLVIMGNNARAVNQFLWRIFIMMQITVDLTTLAPEQREAVAGFILTFPQAAKPVTTKLSDADVTKLADTILAIDHKIPTNKDWGVTLSGGNLTANSATLDPADNPATGMPEPVDVFSDPVAQAFGGNTNPLPVGATAAPYTAVVSASTTAPEVVAAIGVNPTIAPLPPAPPCAPSVPTVAPAATNLAPVDSSGLPWDARIHAETKTKIANGTWKRKRGVDPALVATVEAELRGVVVSATVATVAPVDAWPFPTPNAAVTPAPAPAPAPARPAGEIDPRQQYVALVGQTATAMRDGKITQTEVEEICGKYGVAKLPLLISKPEAVAPVAQEITALIASR